MSVFLPALFIPAFLGFLIASHVFLETQTRSRSWLTLVLATPTGFGAISLILFWSYCMAVGQQVAFTFFLTSFLTGILGISLVIRIAKKAALGKTQVIQKNTDKNRLVQLITMGALAVFTFSLLHFLYYFFNEVTVDVHGGWDARYFWNLKAHFFHRDPSKWLNLFSPELSWSHPDYPFLLPTSVAWGWNWLKKEMLFWPILVNLSFTLSLCCLIIWYLSTRLALWQGLMAGAFFLSLPNYRFWSTTQYADIPLTFFFTAAVLILVEAMMQRKKRLFFFSALMAGFSIWTKNEGLFFAVWMTLMTGLWLMRQKFERKEKIKILLCVGLGFLLPFLSTLYVKLVLAQSTGEFLESGRSLGELLASSFTLERSETLGVAFYIFMTSFPHWGALWIAGVFAAFVFLTMDRTKDERMLLLLFVLFIQVGYFVFLHITPYEISVQIKTALHRLLLHTGVLTLIFSFLVFGRFLLGIGNMGNVKHEH